MDRRTDGGDYNIPFSFLKKRGDNNTNYPQKKHRLGMVIYILMSDLGLNCLPMSYKNEASLIWVTEHKFYKGYSSPATREAFRETLWSCCI